MRSNHKTNRVSQVLAWVSFVLIGLGACLIASPLPGTIKFGSVYFGKPFSGWTCAAESGDFLRCSTGLGEEVFIAKSLKQLELKLSLGALYDKEMSGGPMVLPWAEAEIFKTKTNPSFQILDLNEAHLFAASVDKVKDSGIDQLWVTVQVLPHWTPTLFLVGGLSFLLAVIIRRATGGRGET